MAFDGITVAAMVQELKNALADGRIAKIAQPEPDELLLTIKTPKGQKRLYISASASLPLISSLISSIWMSWEICARSSW